MFMLTRRHSLSILFLPLLLAALSSPARSDGRLYLVTDSPYEIWSGSGTKVQVVVYGPRFRPVQGAAVFAGSRQVGLTDADGTLIFKHRPHGCFRLSARANIGDGVAFGAVSMEAYRRTGSFESANLFVYTDRGVYRPGETIHLRSIAWKLRGDFRPISGARIETLLSAPDGKVISGGQMKTDSFGVAADDLRLPADAPEGAYQLSVSYKGAQEQARLRVKRFRAPAIRIEHNLPRFVAPTTPDLEVSVKLGYFTGGRLEAGSLSVRALYSGKELYSASCKITGVDHYSFKIPLDPIRRAVPAESRFQVELRAKDRFSRGDTVTRDILYSKRPYLAVPDLDKDVYVTGEEVNLTVRVTDPDGIPVRGKNLVIEGDGGKLRLERKTDAGGVALFKFLMPDHDIQVSVSSPDVPTPLFSRRIAHMQNKPMLATLPNPLVRERLRIPIVITFDDGFLPVERVVHGDVTDYSGAITAGFKIRIRKKKGRYIARGSFRAPSWGSMLVTLYSVGMQQQDRKRGRRAATVGLLTEGMSLTAHPDKELHIKLDGVPDKARPRSRLEARFTVSDPRGRKATTSLGVMLVDRAVLSLLDPLEKTPMDRFYNPTLKVLSTTGSDILTWPVVTRNWGNQLYDIALPPFGFQEGAPYYERARRRKSVAGDGGMPKPCKNALGAPMQMDGYPGDVAASPEAERPISPATATKSRARPPAAGRPQAAPQLPKIVIRTDLPATAVWQPKLVARGGRAVLAITLPEALGEQELIVVASDRAGGVGMARKRVKLTQPLMVRSDLPRVMVANDKIEVGIFVRNMTGKKLGAEIRLDGQGLDVTPSSRNLEIYGMSAARAVFTINPKHPGKISYTVSVRAGTASDAERRVLDVRPRGAGLVEEFVGELRAKRPFEKIIELGSDEYVEAHLEIAFPTIVPALQEIDKLLDRSAWWSDSVLATPLAACSIEAYLARYLPHHPLRKKIRAYLSEVTARLTRGANPDGGYGWWRTGRGSNLFATAHAVRLMAALMKSDLAVPPKALDGAISFVKGKLRPDGLWPLDDIAFWEGSTEKVRLQLSAAIFHSLAEALPYLKRGRSSIWSSIWLSEVAGRFEKYLEAPDDPLTAAEAALGLYTFKKVRGKLPQKARLKLLLAAKRLIKLRRRAHWEPSWFHAYGGTIEATVASLELLSRLKRRAFEAELREGLLFLLSTRNEWGRWHCPFGTASALRAFTFLPPARREIPSAVSVRLGGKQIERLKIDPRDPFLSAVRLRHLSLGQELQPGRNKLSVAYTGRLRAPVRLVVRRWKGEPIITAAAGKIAINRSLERKAIEQGQSVQLSVTITNSSLKDDLLLSLPTPGNAEIDKGSIEALRKAPGVLAATIHPGRLELVLAGSRDHKLSYGLIGRRAGKANLPPATVASIMRPELKSATGSAAFDVK